MSDQSTEGRKGEAYSYNVLGNKSLNEDRYDDAYMQFQNAIRLDPDSEESYRNLAMLYFKMGNSRMALKFLEHAMKLHPVRKDNIYNSMAQVYTKAGDYDRAIETYNRSVKYGINRGRIWSAIGYLETRTENYPVAIRAFNTAIETKPTLKNQYIEMLTSLLYMEDFDNVEDIRSRLERGISDSDIARYNSEIAEAFLMRDSDWIDVYMALSDVYERDGQIDAAIMQLNRAIDIWKSTMKLYNQLGILYAKAGRYEEAADAFEEAFRLNPGDRNITRNIEKLRMRQTER
ncbi:MAG: tetratricopeptide repeat protein [Candidatus Electryoneaceae bacterium]|nr:tetratricopeptide repeat protein [Candidatus Electryoneaceae bacterium]